MVSCSLLQPSPGPSPDAARVPAVSTPAPQDSGRASSPNGAPSIVGDLRQLARQVEAAWSDCRPLSPSARAFLNQLRRGRWGTDAHLTAMTSAERQGFNRAFDGCLAAGLADLEAMVTRAEQRLAAARERVTQYRARCDAFRAAVVREEAAQW